MGLNQILIGFDGRPSGGREKKTGGFENEGFSETL